MEAISEELERYSLELSEDESSQPKEDTSKLGVMPPGDVQEKPKALSIDRHGIKSGMNFPAMGVASAATVWNKRRPAPPPQPPADDPAQAKDVIRYMNTYRLESKKPFNIEHVTSLLQEILTRDLATAHYEPNTMTKTCVSLAGEIRHRVKQLNYDRFKLVCLVQIVEKHRQSVLSTARFLWDADRDRYAVFSLNNAHIAAMACVFGVYYE